MPPEKRCYVGLVGEGADRARITVVTTEGMLHPSDGTMSIRTKHYGACAAVMRQLAQPSTGAPVAWRGATAETARQEFRSVGGREATGLFVPRRLWPELGVDPEAGAGSVGPWLARVLDPIPLVEIPPSMRDPRVLRLPGAGTTIRWEAVDAITVTAGERTSPGGAPRPPAAQVHLRNGGARIDDGVTDPAVLIEAWMIYLEESCDSSS